VHLSRQRPKTLAAVERSGCGVFSSEFHPHEVERHTLRNDREPTVELLGTCFRPLVERASFPFQSHLAFPETCATTFSARACHHNVNSCYCNKAPPQTFSVMDLHNLELLFVCMLSKSAPNILWTVRGLLSDNLLQVARSSPAIAVAKISLQSLFERKSGPASLPRSAKL
jgi:hypothetical protein